MPAAAKTNPIRQLSVGRNGELRPVMYTNRVKDLLTFTPLRASPRSIMPRYWRQEGSRILV